MSLCACHPLEGKPGEEVRGKAPLEPATSFWAEQDRQRIKHRGADPMGLSREEWCAMFKCVDHASPNNSPLPFSTGTVPAHKKFPR